MDAHSLSKVTVYMINIHFWNRADMELQNFAVLALYLVFFIEALLLRDCFFVKSVQISFSVCDVLFAVPRRDARHRWRVRGSSYPQLPNVDRRSSCPDNHHCCFLMTMTSTFSERKKERERQNKTINLLSFYHRSMFWIDRI